MSEVLFIRPDGAVKEGGWTAVSAMCPAGGVTIRRRPTALEDDCTIYSTSFRNDIDRSDRRELLQLRSQRSERRSVWQDDQLRFIPLNEATSVKRFTEITRQMN